MKPKKRTNKTKSDLVADNLQKSRDLRTAKFKVAYDDFVLRMLKETGIHLMAELDYNKFTGIKPIIRMVDFRENGQDVLLIQELEAKQQKTNEATAESKEESQQ